MHERNLQPWTTVRSSLLDPISSTWQFTQAEDDWLDVSAFTDAAFWVEVADVTVPSPTTDNVTLSLQSAPSADESYFRTITSIPSLATTTAPICLSSAGGSLSKWLRWQLTSSAAPWSATLCIHAVLSKERFFSPLAVAGCELWTRADLGVTLNGRTAGGAHLPVVSGWANQAPGPSQAPAFALGGGSPTYDATTMNGFASINGDGASYLVTAAYPVSQSFSLFVAVKANGAQGVTARIVETQYNAAYFLGTGSATNYQLIVNYNNSFGDDFGGAKSGSMTISGQNQIVAGTHSSGTPGAGTLYLDGRVGGVESAHFSNPGGTLAIYIFRSAVASANFWNGNIAEVIKYNRVVTTNEFTRINRYLGQRYGVAVP